MRRRNFLKKGAVAAGLVSIPNTLLQLTACKSQNQSSGLTAEAGEEILSSEYLKRVREDKFLPGPPLFAKSKLTPAIHISPMPLQERIKRKVVPRRGFCSLAPGGDPLLSGNGAVNIELAGNPYTEQIAFNHESLFAPRKKLSETTKIANVFPQVRQMMLDGKYHEAVMLAYNEWQKNPTSRGGGGFSGRFSMLLELPAGTTVNNYLRTVDFESTEVKVLWTDEKGNWIRSTFTSRPDNLVVQWLTAPKGQMLNVRIRVTGGGVAPARSTGGGPDFAGIRSRTAVQEGGSGGSKNQMDFNEQRLIFKGRIDPSVDNRGYAGVTRVVRDGGSSQMEGDTLVIGNATSLILLTRIEYIPDYNEEKVEEVHQSVEEVTPDYDALLERARKVQSEMLNRVTVDFGDPKKYGFSSEELLSDQRSSSGYSGAFLKTFFEMCRYLISCPQLLQVRL